MYRIILITLAFIFLNCRNSGLQDGPPFEKIPVLFPISPGIVDEASGIAASLANPGLIWVEQDSRNPPELKLFRENGSFVKKIFLEGIPNRDWEDIALSNGPNPNLKYIYLAEIGDNDQEASVYHIYRFPEPLSSVDTIRNIERISFTFPDGSHDSEALLVDERTLSIYIITKRDDQSKIYKLPYPQSTTATNKAIYLLDLPYKGVVSACSSIGQDEILIKTYGQVYYYKKKKGESIEASLSRPMQKLPYQVEEKGEAICFSAGNKGFFTLSERSRLPRVNLNFYKRR